MNLCSRASLLTVLFSLPLALLLTACSKVESIAIVPAAGVEVLTSIGQTVQYQAYATEQMGSGPTTTDNITNSVTWTSSNPSVASIIASGLLTAQGAGYAQITATSSNNVVAYSDVTVNVASTTGGSGGSSSGIVSIAVIPNAQSVAVPLDTTQFLAIGTTSTGATEDLTTSGSLNWYSSSKQIASIVQNGVNAGYATANTQGTTTITAEYTTAVGTVVTGTASFTVANGSSQAYSALTIIPSSVTISASGQVSNLIALATSGTTGYQTDVTTSPNIQWYSSSIKIASVGLNTGVVTGGNVGSTTITAELTNPGAGGSIVTNTANVTTTSTPAPEPLISLTIIPSSASMGALLDQVQLLAIGTYAVAPYARDLTNSPNLTWLSAFPNDITVDSNSGGGTGATAGVVTAFASTTAAGVPIIAEAVNPLDGTIQTATANVACPLVLPNPAGNPPTPGTCYPGSQGSSLLSTLTVYNEGLNTTSDPGVVPNWLITASSATGTANVIHCGPGWAANGNIGGSVCTATYPVGTTVTLTAPTQKGVSFGGWSYNCAAQGAVTSNGPNTCTVNLTTDETVGAIFN